MKSVEIRNKFLKYFESKGHKLLPGSSLVPSDPTVLLTLAGMLQFKPVFLGLEKPPHKRVATVQKCVRMIDIEQVGKTSRHHTFFEMLGNFSFDDYFKKEAIEFAWELLVKEFGLPADKLLAAVYEKDDEAFSIWNRSIGLAPEKIFRLGEDNNFWSVGPTGPCGPCSEIYYDLGPAKGCGKADCKPGCDCDRFLEIWNLVFIQYDRNEKNELHPLKSKGIDTGMGLERIARLLQGVENNFEIDLFVPLMQRLTEMIQQENPSSLSKKIIVDHIRAITFLISDGVFPENFGRGYVLRRLIRRAVRHGQLLGMKKPFLHKLSQDVESVMKDTYPEICQKSKFISEVIKTEEENFLANLEEGLELFKQILKKYEAEKTIPGSEAFRLHDTYGFPIEITKEIAEDYSYRVDEEGFNREMERQRERARHAEVLVDKQHKLATLDLDRLPPTKFIGYEKTSDEVTVLAVFPKEKLVVFDKTPFYRESGGQIGDKGILNVDKHEILVLDVYSNPRGVYVHEVDNTEGLEKFMRVRATVDASRRKATEIHHTATHLLHNALKEVLGEHVRQAGSYVGPDKLRFDFTHFTAMKPSEIDRVEELLNQKIKERMKVDVSEKNFHDAIKMGAVALFGEKYGDRVRVLKIGNYSMELCTGTHARSTEDLLFFIILSESALGAGLRRIEALAGQAAKIHVMFTAKSMHNEVAELIRKYRLLEIEKGMLGGARFMETGIFEIDITEMESLSKAVDNQDSKNVKKFLEHLTGRVEWLRERIAKAEREIEDLKLQQFRENASVYAKEAIKLGEINVLAKDFKGFSMEMLRVISDAMQKETKSCVVVLASVSVDKLIFLITVTPDLIEKGLSAIKLAEIFSATVGGKSGGKENRVEGGGKDPTKAKEGLERVLELIRK